MIHVIQTRQPERVLLTGLVTRETNRIETEILLEELKNLAFSAGAEVVGSMQQIRKAPHPAHFFGPGKVGEIASHARSLNADTLIVDHDLSPAQQRNLERLTKLKVIDRTELILDIFATRARTREAKLQVELAQYEYVLPRLAGMWHHLERLGGGIGTRGPGETQLETDRRIVRKRISTLKERLKKVERHRKLVRSQRRALFRIALVGYTNAGKSTLMNSLSRAHVDVADQLFMTLDSTTRKLYLGKSRSALLTDTVGFVQRLPHQLVASFHSTLEELREADLLLVVADAESPRVQLNLDVVHETLHEIGAGNVPSIYVLNKIDRIHDEALIKGLLHRYGPRATCVSALKRIGLTELRDMIRFELIKSTHHPDCYDSIAPEESTVS